MKKFIIILLGLVLAIPSFADTVSENKATEAAATFFNKGVATRSAVKPFLVWTGGNGTRAPYAPPFYVFNNPNGGWVVISGEDSGRAILAWSDKGLFDPITLPDNAAAWFEEYANQINWARAHQLTPSEETIKEWAALLDGRIRRTPVAVKELATASWNQGNPYNMFCPTIQSANTVTGCVATAMAIAMRFFKHPGKGHGSIGGYTLNTRIDTPSGTTLTAPTVNLDDESAYDWDNMPLAAPYTSDEKSEIARLIYHCGLASEMKYGISGSSAELRKAYRALVDVFDYDPTAQFITRSSRLESEWIEMIENEIYNDRVVIIDGFGSGGTGGHCFVADGYNTDDEIRINWGWGGLSNGYFAVSYFKTTAGDSSGSDYRFNQHAVIGLKENDGGLFTYNFGLIEGGLKLEDGQEPGESDFTVKAKVVNNAVAAAPCTLRVYIANYQGSIADSIISSKAIKYSSSLNPGYSVNPTGWACNFRNKNNPVLGDKLVVCYKEKGGAVYTPIQSKSASTPDNIAIFDIPFIAVKDGGHYSVGDFFDFEIVNSRNTPNEMNVTWSFDGTPVEIDEATKQASRKLTAAGEHTIKAVVTIGGETQTLVQKILVE